MGHDCEPMAADQLPLTSSPKAKDVDQVTVMLADETLVPRYDSACTENGTEEPGLA